MNTLRAATREEFEAFLKSYGAPLERDVFGAFEPPLVTYNDFARAPMWPDSVVASHYADGTHYQILGEPPRG